ncbi:MAG TPA: hypothetical protein VFO41_09780, partial [Alphaproteobacteria bacterium]|nr:hypothetical protein [Alphaproteobacteria bacterium]
PAMWRAFSASPEIAKEEAPLDAWTRRVLTGIAAATGALALFPFDGPPHLPFQRWARRAEPVHASPLGILIHPEHGLWHAYRGALAFATTHPLPPREARPNPCDACAGRPCLSACPVGAFVDGRYDVDACAQHLAGPAGADCLELGCRARRACPVGRDAAYAPEQAGFHMRAFLHDRSAPGSAR